MTRTSLAYGDAVLCDVQGNCLYIKEEKSLWIEQVPVIGWWWTFCMDTISGDEFIFEFMFGFPLFVTGVGIAVGFVVNLLNS